MSQWILAIYSKIWAPAPACSEIDIIGHLKANAEEKYKLIQVSNVIFSYLYLCNSLWVNKFLCSKPKHLETRTSINNEHSMECLHKRQVDKSYIPKQYLQKVNSLQRVKYLRVVIGIYFSHTSQEICCSPGKILNTLHLTV